MIVHRRQVPIGDCASLREASMRLGGGADLLRDHRRRGTAGFPKPVAEIGRTTLYVFAELEAFYNSVLWRQADKSIDELKGGDAA